MLITTEISVTENRDVAVIDSLGEFLTVDMDEEVIVILENEMVDAILEIDSKLYEKYVICRKTERNTCIFASARRRTER